MNTQWVNYSIIGIALLIGNAEAQQDSPYYPYYLRTAMHDVLTIPWNKILNTADDDWVVAHIYPGADNGDNAHLGVDTGTTDGSRAQVKNANGHRWSVVPLVVAGTANITWLFVKRKQTLKYRWEKITSFNPGFRRIPIDPHGQESVILFRVKGELVDNFVPCKDPRSLKRRHIAGNIYFLPLEWEGKVAEALAYFAKNDGAPENIVESVTHENPLIAIGSVAMSEPTFDDWLRCLRARKRGNTGDKRDKLVEQALLRGTLNSAKTLLADQAADRQIKKIIRDLGTEEGVFWYEYKNERREESIAWLVKRLVAKKGKISESSNAEALLKEPHLPAEATAILQNDYFRGLGLERDGRSRLLLADKIGSDCFQEPIENLAAKPWKAPLGGRLSAQWAALMIKSKRGDDAAAAKLVEVFRGRPDLRRRLDGLSDIGWTGHPQAWNALAELVMSDERLLTTKGAPGTSVCWIAARAMEIYVPGFPNGKTKPAILPPSYRLTIGSHGFFSYTEEEIERCREWVRQQPWYKE